MKKTNIGYWIFTILLAVLMLISAIPNIMVTQSSIELVTNHLGYPKYFIAFIGVAKLLGVIAILVPAMPRIKEWAYAGFTFDLLAALYSSISVGDPISAWAPLLLGPLLIAGSYYFNHRRMQTGIEMKMGLP